jgi:hypothetical protein
MSARVPAMRPRPRFAFLRLPGLSVALLLDAPLSMSLRRSHLPSNKALEPDREPGFAGSGPHSRARPVSRCGAREATGSRPLSLIVRRRI